MALLKEERRREITEKKIRLTGKTESCCRDCKQTKSVRFFDIYPTSKDEKRPYKVRTICIPCANKTRKPQKRKKTYKDCDVIKQWVKTGSKRATELISDSYIKRLYWGFGYRFDEVTPEMVAIKRKEIKQRRENAANKVSEKKRADGTYNKLASATMSDGYVRARIKASTKYKGEEITDEMMANKREEIEIHRIIKKINIKKKNEKSSHYKFFVPNDIRNQR
jgi:hypothetical protein